MSSRRRASRSDRSPQHGGGAPGSAGRPLQLVPADRDWNSANPLRLLSDPHLREVVPRSYPLLAREHSTPFLYSIASTILSITEPVAPNTTREPRSADFEAVPLLGLFYSPFRKRNEHTNLLKGVLPDPTLTPRL